MKKILQEDKLIFQAQGDLIASRLQEYIVNSAGLLDEPDGYQEVILDLSEITNIDSTGITFIIGIYKMASKQGKQFQLIGLRQDVYHLFKLMKLDQIFTIKEL